ncbi:T9SS type A sorting domain-containing protein [Flavivirga rizhaonensis]|nr:T9SS type A sorting domain-containing protein [Flavivirga rizhaonensis]
MNKNYFLATILILQISFINAQSELVYWTGQNTSTNSYPQSGSGLSSEITSADQNYNGLNTYADNRNVWNNPSSSASVDPGTTPYLSYELNTNTSLQFDRFVVHGAAPTTAGIKMQLRWSIDNYASSLGDFTPGSSSYNLTSVDISSTSIVPSGTVEFRIYYYAVSGNVFHSGTGPYSTTDATPSSYTSYGRCFSVWGSQSVLSNGHVENKLSPKIYPNPSSNYIKITGNKAYGDYSIYSTIGTKVKEGSIKNNEEEIDIDLLDKGLYLIQFNKGITLKFLKQ